MIWWLVRRDLSLRVATPAMLLGALATLAFVKAPSLVLLLGLPYCFCVWAWMPKRGSAFDAALPIRGRELFAAHYLSSLTLMVIPLVIGAAMGVAHQQRDLSIGVMLEYIPIAALATLLPYGLRSGQLREPPLPLTVVCWAALAAVSTIIIRVLDPFVGLMLLAIATIVFARELWTSLPDSLQLTARAALADRPKPVVLDRIGWSVPAVIPEYWKAIARSQFPPIVLFLYPALVLSAFYGEWLLLLFIATGGIASAVRGRLRWLDSFPLSHRTKLCILLIPSAVGCLACLEIGRLAAPLFPELRPAPSQRAPTSSIDPYDQHNLTRVPVDYWERYRGMQLPVILAPWGESIVADTLTLMGETLFDPYTTAAQSSPRFVEWQLGRATTTVYGFPISVVNYADERRATPILNRDPRLKLLSAGVLITFLLLVIWVSESDRWYVLHRDRIVRYACRIATTAAMLLLLLLYWTRIENRRTEVVIPAVRRILSHALSFLPGGIALAGLVAALPVLAAFALLEWQFARGEVPRRVVKVED